MREALHQNIPFAIDEAWLLERLHCQRDALLFERSMELLAQYHELFRPAYLVREFAIDEITHDGICLGGQYFHSRIVASKLRGLDTALIYIATCGKQLSRLIEQTDDLLDQYLLDQLAYAAYLRAMSVMAEEIGAKFGIAQYRILCPGSIPDWSVAEVKQFFTLMDGLYQPLDLRVLDSGLIDPLKSTSGIIYATEEEFESCAICTRANCESRRMPFDPQQHEEMSAL